MYSVTKDEIESFRCCNTKEVKSVYLLVEMREQESSFLKKWTHLNDAILLNIPVIIINEYWW